MVDAFFAILLLAEPLPFSVKCFRFSCFSQHHDGVFFALVSVYCRDGDLLKLVIVQRGDSIPNERGLGDIT
jgi:hypothetical protein